MKYLLMMVPLFYFLGCSSPNDEIYVQTLNEWKSDRLASLKQPLGYLSLSGLEWIQEGTNTIGSDEANDIVLPSKTPPVIGEIVKNGDVLTAKIKHPEIMVNGSHQKEFALLPDSEAEHPVMNWKSYYWYLIKRGDRYGIRVKDTLADMRMHLNHIPAFEPSTSWIIEADYIAPKLDEKQTFKNHVDVTYENDVKGRLQFQYGGKPYELVATNGGEDKLFIVFGDDTNGDETYGGGRFLDLDIPKPGEKAILDFNKAENPICSFNDFGTCPYPPAQNILDFPVLAGEQKVRDK